MPIHYDHINTEPEFRQPDRDRLGSLLNQGGRVVITSTANIVKWRNLAALQFVHISVRRVSGSAVSWTVEATDAGREALTRRSRPKDSQAIAEALREATGVHNVAVLHDDQDVPSIARRPAATDCKGDPQ